MKKSVSRDHSFYGHEVANSFTSDGDVDIKGQNNRRQIVFGLSMGLAGGLVTSLGFFAGNMHLFAESLPAVVVTVLTYGLVAIWNTYRGKPIEEIAKEITDRVMGEEENKDVAGD